MKASVADARSSHGDAATAVEAAFARADDAIVRALLAVVTPLGADDAARIDVVRARLARAEGDVTTWHEAASRASERHPSLDRRLVADTLRAIAARRAGRPENFAAVERAVLRAAPRVAGYAAYMLALEAYFHREYERAETLIARNLEACVHEPESHALRGWIASDREYYAVAATHFLAALAALDASGEVDERLRARMAIALATIASETVDLALGARARVAYAAIRWTDALATDHVRVLVALRDVALLEGDVTTAWLLARRGTALLSQGPYAVLAECSAASVARLMGDARAAALQLERANCLLVALDWSTCTFAARQILVRFATEAARTMPAEARAALTRYRSLLALPNPIEAFEEDRRGRAAELTAEALVVEATGPTDTAIRCFELALAAWRELGHDAGAAQTAAELFRLTGETRYAAIVDGVLARAPNAWLKRALVRAEEPLERLSRCERKVFDQLLRGKSAKAIGAALDRSPHTIANHTRKIFTAFGVSSRSMLLARCVELGISFSPGE